jgi:hypothetical protein
MSSNLHRSFLFKCRNEFRPLVRGRANKIENYFCRWLHGEISQYDSGERCGPWASFFPIYCYTSFMLLAHFLHALHVTLRFLHLTIHFLHVTIRFSHAMIRFLRAIRFSHACKLFWCSSTH